MDALSVISVDVKKLYIEWGIEVFQQDMLSIFFGEDGLVGGDVPIDAEGVVEDADATFCLRMIELVTLVLEHRCLTQHRKTVGHSFRNKELTMVILCQFYSDVLTVGGTAFTDVDDDIEDGTLDTADEFALGEWGALEVQATHDTVGTHAFVVLDERDGGNFLVELTL